jgi:heat shock protein HtpX
MLAFTVLVVLCAYAISLYRNINPYVALTLGLGLSVASGFVSYFYSDRIALSVSRAHETKREEYTELYRIVENLAITAGIQAPRIYVIEDGAPNAFATGRNEKHSAIAVTTGLLNMLDKSELEGVIAHELSHIGNRDILIMSVAVVLAGSVSILSNFFLRSGFGGRRRSSNNDNGGGGLLAILGLILLILAPLFATLLRLAVSRKREFVADATAGLITRYPDGLASALRKIGAYHTPMMNVNNATAHLFISDPRGTVSQTGKPRTSLFARLFSTHPPIEERITALVGQARS